MSLLAVLLSFLPPSLLPPPPPLSAGSRAGPAVAVCIRRATPLGARICLVHANTAIKRRQLIACQPVRPSSGRMWPLSSADRPARVHPSDGAAACDTPERPGGAPADRSELISDPICGDLLRRPPGRRLLALLRDAGREATRGMQEVRRCRRQPGAATGYQSGSVLQKKGRNRLKLAFL